MIKQFLLFLIFLFFSNIVLGQDNLLTVKQELERLQREVSDISKILNKNSNTLNNENKPNSKSIQNFTAIDDRIFEIEKDIKNLTLNLEELNFKIDDLNKILSSLDEDINFKFQEFMNSMNIKNQSNLEITDENSLKLNQEKKQENTLGELTISSDEKNNQKDELVIDENQNVEPNLSPEEQFQSAFDKIRSKKYNEAKDSFKNFIDQNPDNQLSGSAHYWLGELYVLEKNYRESALIFAEGYQKYPKSIKGPDMLYKLGDSLFELDKINDGCRTLNKFNEDYPTHKLKGKVNKLLFSKSCNEEQ